MADKKSAKLDSDAVLSKGYSEKVVRILDSRGPAIVEFR